MPTIHSTIVAELAAAAEAAGFRIIGRDEDGDGLLLSLVAQAFDPEFAEYSDYGVTTCRISRDGTMTAHEDRFLLQPPATFLDVEAAVQDLVERERQAITSAAVQGFDSAFAAAGMPIEKVDTTTGGGAAIIRAKVGSRVAEATVRFEMRTGILTVDTFWNRRTDTATVRTLEEFQDISDRLGAEVGNYLDERRAA